MRSTFGRFAMELRARRGMSQTEFSARVGLSLSRICNIEFQRAAVSDDVVREYIASLNCSGDEAHELRKRATFANSIKRATQNGVSNPPLLALFEQFSERVSPKAAAEIQRILERETGESVESLAFSSNQRQVGSKATKRIAKEPSILPIRFVEICLIAHKNRLIICNDMARLDVALALEKLSVIEDKLDYRVRENMPSYMDGAFACIVGEQDGHTILIEEKRFVSAANGVHFARHVIGHEIGHHYLHPELLVSSGEVFLAPQELAKNTCDMISSDRQIAQVIDSITELEAEVFATFFLVPWTAFFKGTAVHHLANDYGEQLGEVKRYAPYFKNRAVIDAFKNALWLRGERQHVLFSLS
jgi:transcriptional regulator with XRE-family HTH domain